MNHPDLAGYTVLMDTKNLRTKVDTLKFLARREMEDPIPGQDRSGLFDELVTAERDLVIHLQTRVRRERGN